jgi:selenocysteine lyase/cysteine desulfurase
VLYVRPGVEKRLATLREGGTGSSSEEDRHPRFLPDKYESGNHNVPGILGLGAGAAYLLEHGVDALRCHEQELTARLIEGLGSIPHVRLFGPPENADRVGVVSIAVEGYAPHEFAGVLDDQFRIQVRSGLHCAPLAHRALGTLEQGGTVRFSVGPFNTVEQIDTTVSAVREIAEAALSV